MFYGLAKRIKVPCTFNTEVCPEPQENDLGSNRASQTYGLPEFTWAFQRSTVPSIEQDAKIVPRRENCTAFTPYLCPSSGDTSDSTNWSAGSRFQTRTVLSFEQVASVVPEKSHPVTSPVCSSKVCFRRHSRSIFVTMVFVNCCA